LRGLVTQTLKYGRIETTLDRAKDARRIVEKMITLGKRGDLHSRRRAAAVIYEKDVVYELFNSVAGQYMNRNGGYTRVLKLGPRRGDGAEMAILELV
jgi:large subunit ribosomal protein L17